MSEWAPKRFWKSTEVAQTEGGYTVTLDGRSVRTPAKTLLVLPTQTLANAIAAEWDAQEDKVDPNTMPFTRTSNSALDKVRIQFSEVADMLADYGDSDLLCYRADGPAELVERQARKWDPVLDWAAQELGARLESRQGIMHEPQDASALAELRARVHSLSAFQLAAFHDLVSLPGSLILGFATSEGKLPAQEAWKLSRLDEIWQAEQWGKDDEAEQMANIKQAAFEHASKFFGMAA
ncbi:ATP12 family chaperone protein [Thalassococcus lentus]|uniref:ATPase n=1 Tax=Thalassococcus lentus TaxID=1210524 RepID=A0ABT4XME8_9RHOB|nr:ATP12 family protein [Thalassococcus lentus]MDA7423117.1 ATPase [Thalassococcus lentus]